MPPGAEWASFREGCLCRLGRNGRVFVGTVCAAWGGMVGSEKKAPVTEADGREVEYSLLRQ